MNICFIGSLSHAFARRDYDILNKYFNVNVIEPPKKTIDWIKYPHKVAKKVKECDIIFSWFAGWHSLFPTYYAKKYDKKTIVVIGGYDVANVTEIVYGAFNNIKEKISSLYVLKNNQLLLAVSEFNKNEIMDKINHKNIKVIYNGVDTNKYKLSNKKKQDIVLTVSGIKKSNLDRKGLITFVKSAKLLPELQFVIIGKTIDNSVEYLKKIAPKNVNLIGFLSEKDLIKYYQKAKVVCQLSYYESFGLAPAEAMACGCVPVITNERIGVSEVINELGFFVKYGDHKQTAKKIKKAVQNSDKLQKKVEERIRKSCSLDLREEKLKNIILNV